MSYKSNIKRLEKQLWLIDNEVMPSFCWDLNYFIEENGYFGDSERRKRFEQFVVSQKRNQGDNSKTIFLDKETIEDNIEEFKKIENNK
ncbi:hypothetical protein GYA13_00575 [Candidatus Kuenenbacteria bacterium]|nr:hypothetical protein [Candidatus Kuenenbacteria bacterium]